MNLLRLSTDAIIIKREARTINKKPSSHYNPRGWWIIFGAFLILAINYGSRYSFGVFLKPMAEELGWSRSCVSLGASLNMLFYSVFSILTGQLIDRMSPRWIITVGSSMAALCFYLTAFVEKPLTFYLLYGVLSGMSSASMGVVVVNSYVGKCFSENRGTAIGIATMGISAGTIVLTPTSGFIAKHLSWREGFLILGIITITVGVVVAQVLMRSEPSRAEVKDEQSPSNPNKPLLSQMLRDNRFVTLALCFSLAVMSLMATFVHQIAFAVERGIEKMVAASSLSITAFAGLAGQFAFGLLSDHIRDPKYAAAIGFITMALGMLFLIHVESSSGLYCFALVFGFGYGSLAPMMPILLVDRFGQRTMGTIYGYVTLFVGIGGAFGPFIAGLIYDITQSYAYVWWLNVAIFALVSLLILKLRYHTPM